MIKTHQHVQQPVQGRGPFFWLTFKKNYIDALVLTEVHYVRRMDHCNNLSFIMITNEPICLLQKKVEHHFASKQFLHEPCKEFVELLIVSISCWLLNWNIFIWYLWTVYLTGTFFGQRLHWQLHLIFYPEPPGTCCAPTLQTSLYLISTLFFFLFCSIYMYIFHIFEIYYLFLSNDNKN